MMLMLWDADRAEGAVRARIALRQLKTAESNRADKPQARQDAGDVAGCW
jgi:hypothetical protein